MSLIQPQTCNGIPILGHFTGDEDLYLVRWIGDRQENAIDYDHYPEESSAETLTVEEKVKAIEQRRDQHAEHYLETIYPGMLLLTATKALKRLKATDSESKISNERLFLPTKTPSKFNFSSVFLMNNPYQGILHSFLRYYDKWNLVQPYVDSSLKKLSPVQNLITEISAAYYISTARSAITRFLEKMETLEVRDYNEVQTTLNEIQVVLAKTIQDKMEYQLYRGEGVNEMGQIQTFFQVKENLVAVVGFSRELFLAESKHDKRPFRTIITIYFIDDAECHRRTVMKSY